MSARVPVYGRHGVVAYALVDASSQGAVLAYRWNLIAGGYAVTRLTRKGKTQRTLYMHRLILGLDFGDGRVTDHINRDRLDNRRSNLRVATAAQNSQNRGSKPGSKSPYRGVTFDPSRDLWRAFALRKTIGRFPTELEAARAAAQFRVAHMTHTVEDTALLEHVA